MMQGKARHAKIVEYVADFPTFWLAILGTFLTRAASSVRGTPSPSLRSADDFKWFLLITLGAFTFFFFKNKSHLAERT